MLALQLCHSELDTSMDKRSQRSERTKQNIILAAMDCYRRYGVQGASLDLIAKQANSTKPTIYSHFGSKEKLYKCVVTTIIKQEQLEYTFPNFDPNQPVREQLIGIFTKQLDRVMECDQRRLLVALTIEALHQGKSQFSMVKSIKTCSIETWFIQAIEHGALAEQNTSELAHNLWALINGRCFFPVFLGMAPDDPAERHHNLHSAIDFFLTGQNIK